MPISIVCPGCGGGLSAPDSAAGQRVRCPRPGCGTVVPVAPLIPAVEVEAEPPDPPPRMKAVAVELDDEDEAPARAKRRRDEDEDEDDEGDRPVRKKRRRRKKSGGSAYPVMIAAGVVVALLVAGGVGLGFLLASRKQDQTAGANGGTTGGGSGAAPVKAAVPAGWREFRSDREKFRAYFPGTPQVRTVNPPPGGGPIRPRSIAAHSWTDGGRERTVALLVLRFGDDATQADRDALFAGFLREGGQSREERSVTWAGRPARELIVEESRRLDEPGTTPLVVVRYMVVENTGYIGMVGNKRTRPPDGEVNGFFDNFELLD